MEAALPAGLDLLAEDEEDEERWRILPDFWVAGRPPPTPFTSC